MRIFLDGRAHLLLNSPFDGKGRGWLVAHCLVYTVSASCRFRVHLLFPNYLPFAHAILLKLVTLDMKILEQVGEVPGDVLKTSLM